MGTENIRVTMGVFDLFDEDYEQPNRNNDWERNVFDTDRFRRRSSGNWVDWEDVSTGDCDTDGFEHPNFDEDGEW